MYLTLKKILRASSVLESVERRSENKKITLKSLTEIEKIDFVETFTNISKLNTAQIAEATNMYYTLYNQEISRQNSYIKDINESLNEVGEKGATPQTLSETILNIILNLAQMNIYQYENLTLVDYRKIAYYQGERIRKIKEKERQNGKK